MAEPQPEGYYAAYVECWVCLDRNLALVPASSSRRDPSTGQIRDLRCSTCGHYTCETFLWPEDASSPSTRVDPLQAKKPMGRQRKPRRGGR